MECFLAGIAHSADAITIFFAGCNFRCPFCFAKPFLETKEEFRSETREVKKLIQSAHQDKIILTGGEPCLQRPALVDIASYAKKHQKTIVLETNGAHPHVIVFLMEQKLIDELRLDIKTPFTGEIFEKATRSATFFKPTMMILDEIHNTLTYLKDNGHDIIIEINTTIVPGLIFRKEDLLQIAEAIQDIRCSWTFTPFSPDYRELNNSNFKNILSPSEDFLQTLRKSILKQYPAMNIIIIDPPVMMKEKEF